MYDYDVTIMQEERGKEKMLIVSTEIIEKKL